MYVLFHIHPAFKDAIPYGAEERLAAAAREHGRHANFFRVYIGPGIDGLRAKVELNLGHGLRHRFTTHADNGQRLVDQVESRLRRFLVLMPPTRDLASNDEAERLDASAASVRSGHAKPHDPGGIEGATSGVGNPL